MARSVAGQIPAGGQRAGGLFTLACPDRGGCLAQPRVGLPVGPSGDVPGLRPRPPTRAGIAPDPARFLRRDHNAERSQIRLARAAFGHDEPGFLGEGRG